MSYLGFGGPGLVSASDPLYYDFNHVTEISPKKVEFVFEYLQSLKGSNLHEFDNSYCGVCYKSQECKDNVKRDSNGICKKCKWNKWSSWSRCQGCDVPKRKDREERTRTLVDNHTDRNGGCGGGKPIEYGNPCVPCVDCAWSSWRNVGEAQFDKCPSCGALQQRTLEISGSQSQTRSILQRGRNGGRTCQGNSNR